MKEYEIRHGLGGGFGGAGEWGTVTANSLDDAERQAYEAACEEYEMYDGMHGLDSIEDIREEHPDHSESEAEEEWRECRESWLDYGARLKPTEGDPDHE